MAPRGGAAGYTPLYDRSLGPERIGSHPFEKLLPRTDTGPPGAGHDLTGVRPRR